jgi:hypothetical protein
MENIKRYGLVILATIILVQIVHFATDTTSDLEIEKENLQIKLDHAEENIQRSDSIRELLLKKNEIQYSIIKIYTDGNDSIIPIIRNADNDQLDKLGDDLIRRLRERRR